MKTAANGFSFRRMRVDRKFLRLIYRNDIREEVKYFRSTIGLETDEDGNPMDSGYAKAEYTLSVIAQTVQATEDAVEAEFGPMAVQAAKEGKWMCLNCGHIHSGKQVPEICPLCRHARGYFIPLSLAPYIGALTGSEMEE